MRFFFQFMVILSLSLSFYGLKKAKADDGESDENSLHLSLQFVNQASQSLSFEDGNDFDADNIYINASILRNTILSKETRNIVRISWPEEGESSFHYTLYFRSHDQRYFCALKVKALYYDTEVGKKLFVRSMIENAPSPGKKYEECDKVRFQSNFTLRSNGNGLVSVITKDF